MSARIQKKKKSAGTVKADKTYHHGDLKNSLVQAGIGLLEEEGIEALSLRKVAARAGVSHAAPYRHFADREALLAAIAKEGFWKLMKLSLSRAGQKSGVARLKSLSESYIKFAIEHPGFIRVMFGSELRDKSKYEGLAEADYASFKLMLDVIKAGQEIGTFRKHRHPEAQAFTIWSFLHGLSSLLIENQLDHIKGRGTGLGLARAQLDILLEGLVCTD